VPLKNLHNPIATKTRRHQENLTILEEILGALVAISRVYFYDSVGERTLAESQMPVLPAAGCQFDVVKRSVFGFFSDADIRKSRAFVGDPPEGVERGTGLALPVGMRCNLTGGLSWKRTCWSIPCHPAG
jgi:hypothetical protein